MATDLSLQARVRNAAERTIRICESLLVAAEIDAALVTRDAVPPLPGIYIWRRKRESRPAYIGVGLGRKGLRQRIVQQHLCPSYTKSVFRKEIERTTGVGPKQGSVDSIRSTFMLAILVCHEEAEEIVKAAEALLIAALSPEINKQSERADRMIHSRMGSLGDQAEAHEHPGGTK